MYFPNIITFLNKPIFLADKMSEQKIVIRTIVNMIGKPKELLEKILKEYIQELKKEKGVVVLKEDYAKAKEQEKAKE